MLFMPDDNGIRFQGTSGCCGNARIRIEFIKGSKDVCESPCTVVVGRMCGGRRVGVVAHYHGRNEGMYLVVQESLSLWAEE